VSAGGEAAISRRRKSHVDQDHHGDVRDPLLPGPLGRDVAGRRHPVTGSPAPAERQPVTTSPIIDLERPPWVDGSPATCGGFAIADVS
jgi:hypothetical protein